MDREASRRLFEEAQRLLPGGVDSPVRAFRAVGGEPFFGAGGAGARLTDVDGNDYLDYVGSWGPLILGHAHPAVLAALREAIEGGTSYGAPTELGGRLGRPAAAGLPERPPGDHGPARGPPHLRRGHHRFPPGLRRGPGGLRRPGGHDLPGEDHRRGGGGGGGRAGGGG